MSAPTDQKKTKLKAKDFASDQDVRWCPGCGDYYILKQTLTVLAELGIPHENQCFISGIGCSSRFPYYVNSYGVHGIHGRAPAIAFGVKAANPELNLWIITGDGDGLSIGGNHLIHILRRNLDCNILLFNNAIYGLTKGQYSPTSPQGLKTKTTPQGSLEQPFNPISVALGAGATFVARTHDKDSTHMRAILHAATKHKGTSFIEILQNCPIFYDGVWESVTGKAVRPEQTLSLEDGKPLIYGAKNDKAIQLVHGDTQTVDVASTDPESLYVHNLAAPNPGIAFTLAQMRPPEFPLPIGIFRQVQRAEYTEQMLGQEASKMQAVGKGTLEGLLNKGEVITVK